MKHVLVNVDAKGKCSFDFRPVHMNTLTTDVEPVPKKRAVLTSPERESISAVEAKTH